MTKKTIRRPHLLATTLWLLQKSMTPEDATDVLEESGDDATAGGERVRCPLCGWRPRASSRWVCDDCGHPEHFYNGCGHVWNTFDTRGLCAGCGHLWRWTSCLDCGAWSPHGEWYATDSD